MTKFKKGDIVSLCGPNPKCGPLYGHEYTYFYEEKFRVKYANSYCLEVLRDVPNKYKNNDKIHLQQNYKKGSVFYWPTQFWKMEVDSSKIRYPIGSKWKLVGHSDTKLFGNLIGSIYTLAEYKWNNKTYVGLTRHRILFTHHDVDYYGFVDKDMWKKLTGGGHWERVKETKCSNKIECSNEEEIMNKDYHKYLNGRVWERVATGERYVIHSIGTKIALVDERFVDKAIIDNAVFTRAGWADFTLYTMNPKIWKKITGGNKFEYVGASVKKKEIPVEERPSYSAWKKLDCRSYYRVKVGKLSGKMLQPSYTTNQGEFAVFFENSKKIKVHASNLTKIDFSFNYYYKIHSARLKNKILKPYALRDGKYAMFKYKGNNYHVNLCNISKHPDQWWCKKIANKEEEDNMLKYTVTKKMADKINSEAKENKVSEKNKAPKQMENPVKKAVEKAVEIPAASVEESMAELHVVAHAYVDAENMRRIERLKSKLKSKTAVCMAEVKAIEEGCEQPEEDKPSVWGEIKNSQFITGMLTMVAVALITLVALSLTSL